MICLILNIHRSITQSTVSKHEKKIRDTDHVKSIQNAERHKVSEHLKLNAVLSFEDKMNRLSNKNEGSFLPKVHLI